MALKPAVQAALNAVLLESTEKGEDAHVEQALANGAEITASAPPKGNTALHLAILNGHTRIAEYLVEHHNAILNLGNDLGHTPLHTAIEMGQTDMVHYLIRHGANINARGHDEVSPLHTAIEIGNNEIVNELLSAGADITTPTSGNWTFLQCAATAGNSDAARSLLSLGENPILQNDAGQNAIEMAHDGAYHALSQYLAEIANKVIPRPTPEESGIDMERRNAALYASKPFAQTVEEQRRAAKNDRGQGL